jgi:hypothetical protein
MSFTLDTNESLSLDIKRSIILAEYIKCWGLPENRTLLSVDNMLIEVYVFPGEDMDQVSRVATIGLSSCKFRDGKNCNSELLMVLPYDIVDDEIEFISKYILDISTYIVNTLIRNIESEEIITGKKGNRAPKGWPSALLFDEPRGEPNELNNFYIGMQHVKLSWVVPIFDSEYDLINNNGIESFDAAINEAELSLVEVRRDACI